MIFKQLFPQKMLGLMVSLKDTAGMFAISSMHFEGMLQH